MQKELIELYDSLPKYIYVDYVFKPEFNTIMYRHQFQVWCEEVRYWSSRTSPAEFDGASSLEKLQNWHNDPIGQLKFREADEEAYLAQKQSKRQKQSKKNNR